MNLVCRNIEKRNDLLTRMKAIFPLVLTCKLVDDVNEVKLIYLLLIFIHIFIYL